MPPNFTQTSSHSAQLAPTGLSNQFFSASGGIYVSVDAAGSNSGPTTIHVNKKNATSTVRQAFLLAASTGFQGDTIPDGSLIFQGTGITWDTKLPSGIASENYLADATSIVKPVVDAAPAGIVNLSVDEGVNTFAIDGEVLAVVFDDSSQTATHSVILLFGAQATTGDTFAVTLAQPIDPTATGALADFGLGISFGYQTGGTQQYSIVNVNSQRLTTSAGGEDDCRDATSANGCLITAGGIGDSDANPVDPNATPTNPRSDDELYSLLPFITATTTSISVFTQNPSNDDNIFFAYFDLSAAAVVGEGIVLAPDTATNPVGTDHTVTATVVNTLGQPIVGRTVTFSVISGPNAGAGGSGVTDGSGQASFTYTGSGGPGSDEIQASFIDDTGTTVTSNVVTKIWQDISTPTNTPADTPTNTPTATHGGELTRTPTATLAPTNTHPPELTRTPTPTLTPTKTNHPEATRTPTQTLTCPDGKSRCGSTCVDKTSDNNNCGVCGNVCPSDATCIGGICTCATGQTLMCVTSSCPAGEIACGGTCTDPNTDPNHCGGCGTVCPSADTCAAGTCVPPAVAGACLPTSSLAILLQGTNVSAYVPNGSWSESTPNIQLVPLEGVGTRATIATTVPVNSCSSNSLTGETVCTGNSNDVYLITGSTVTMTLTAGSDGTFEPFSGGSCQTCGVAVNSGNNTAVLSVGFAGGGAFQTLHLTTNVFDAPIPTGGTGFSGSTSEDIAVDPARHLVLSPNESANYQLLNTLTGTVFNNSIAGGGDFDSAGEDCSTGIALAPTEFTGNIFIADLTQATFGAGTWSAPSQIQTLPELGVLSAGTSGIAVAPGSHLAIVTGEFGGSAFGVLQLPSTSGSGTPAIPDWIQTYVPNEPSGASFSMGDDPHTVSAYTSPNSGKALGVMSDDARAFLVVVDLQGLLTAPRNGAHTVDPTVAAGFVTFVSVF